MLEMILSCWGNIKEQNDGKGHNSKLSKGASQINLLQQVLYTSRFVKILLMKGHLRNLIVFIFIQGRVWHLPHFLISRKVSKSFFCLIIWWRWLNIISIDEFLKGWGSFPSFKSNYPPGMRRRSDVSFWSHLSWDVADHIETSSRRRYWRVNETDLFGTLLRRLTGT